MTLHPCPYCSCPLVAVERNEEGGAVVACGNCGMTGPESVDGDEDEAMAGWELLCSRMCSRCRKNLIRHFTDRISELKAQLEQKGGDAQ